MINVSTRAQLFDALASAQAGDEIVLAAGDYGSFDFNGYNYSGYVTVRSADPDNPAVFDQIDIVNSSYLVIDSVHVDNPSNGVASSKVVNISGNSHDIVFSNSEVNGSVATTTDYNEFQGHYGIYTGGDVRNIRVEGNYVHDVKNGFVALGSDDIEVVGNRFDRLGNDTMKFAGVTGVLIENNIGPSSNFQAPTAHVDFIQFQGSSEDITIRGNVYLAGNIGSTQAIFMADGSYNNVLIEQNILYTGMLHGITVYSGANVTIRDNTVLNAPDLVHKATIIQSPDGATVTGNIISTTGYGGKVSGGNLYVQHDRPDQAHHYGDYFENAEAGLGITLDDLVPLAGSLAEQYGAYERLMELLNGETWEPDPVPQPDPDPEPDPDPQPEPDPDPADGTAFSLTDDLEIAGAADVFEMEHSAELELSEGTVAFSFTANGVSGTQGLVSKDAGGYVGGGHHFAVFLDGNTLMVRLQDDANEVYLSFDGIEAGTNYDVAVTFGPDGGELWVDGELIATTDLAMDWTQNRQHLQWGGLGWASANGSAGFDAPFGGTISNATIYESVLTTGQIGALATGDTASPPIVGTASDNMLTGDAGSNVIEGYAGNDVLSLSEADAGAIDTLDGGADTDTADFSQFGAAVWVDLDYALGLEVWTRDTGTALPGFAGTWREIADLVSIENVTGSAFDDMLIGDGKSNVIKGGAGDDLIKLTEADAGAIDTLDGGADTDTADFSGFNAAVWVDLDFTLGLEAWTRDTGTALPGFAGTWREIADLVSIENVTGSAFDDVLIGDANSNEMRGLDGNDQLRLTEAGTGAIDLLDGGGGTDTADFSQFGAAVWVDLDYALGLEVWTRDTGTALPGFGGTWREIADLVSIENVTGSAFDDVLIGNNQANILRAGGGNDMLTGEGGADQFVFRFSSDGTVETSTITDFDLGTDVLTVNGLSEDAFYGSSTFGSMTDGGGTDTTITLATGDRLILEDVTVAEIEAHYASV